jgi:hypothetical protein
MEKQRLNSYFIMLKLNGITIMRDHCILYGSSLEYQTGVMN